MNDNLEIITETYFNPKYQSNNPKELLKKIKQLYPDIDIKVKEIENFLLKTKYKQINKISNTDIRNKQIPIIGQPGTWQIDLTFYDQYKKANSGYGIILSCIDINTRYAFCYMIKKKDKNTVSKAIEQFIQDTRDKKQKIKLIESDNGNEFNNDQVKPMLDNLNIKYSFFNKSVSPNAVMIVERFNKTIRHKIDQYLKEFETHKFIDILKDLLENYNNSTHSSTELTPQEASEQTNYIDKNQLRKYIRANKLIDKQIKPDDQDQQYRVYKQKKVFAKGKEYKYSQKLHTIQEKVGNQFKLDNDQLVAPYRLKPSKETIQNPNINKPVKVDLKEQKKENKNLRQLKKEGIDNSDFKPVPIKKDHYLNL